MTGSPSDPLELAKQWLAIIAKGENLTTACSDPITIADADTLRGFAAFALKAINVAVDLKTKG